MQEELYLKKSGRGLIVYLVTFALAMFLIYSFMNPQESTDTEELSYTELMQRVEDGEIGQIYAEGNNLYALNVDTTIAIEKFPQSYDASSIAPSQEALDNRLTEIANERGVQVSDIVQVSYNPEPPQSLFMQILPTLIITGILVLVFVYFMRQSQSNNKNAMSFGKSQAKMNVDGKNKKTFDDVAGADEEKQELEELVDFLKHPDRFTKIGARIPKGVLLVGPPGTGKTLLAKAVAGEADVPFFSISGSDFVEMFVGVGASRVRDMFRNAKKNAPCILFIDEIDAVGRHRGAGLGGGHDEREQTLNQLLTEMDGFEVNEGIIVLAATNRRDILDPALLRPGRFDRQVVVNRPDVKGRENIFKVHARNKPFDDNVDFKAFARSTPGTTGADIENILNEAAILAARGNKKSIGNAEIQDAIMKVMIGPEKRSRLVTARDQEITAYHEVGHAICANLLPNCDDVQEISIISRGMAAGYTMTLPSEDLMHMTKSKLLDEIAMMLGGRVAEEVMVGDVSTGASSDLQRATEIARKMVINFGMSDNIGMLFLGSEEEVFLGKEYGHTKNYSEDIAAKVDAEIAKILDDARKRAKDILTKNKALVERVTRALVEREKLNKEEFQKLMDGETLPPIEKKPEPKKEEPKAKSTDTAKTKEETLIQGNPIPASDTN
ncbi:MAG: ATP-dependent zinc metalloprotease FtsH [Eubacteriales bacterium]